MGANHQVFPVCNPIIVLEDVGGALNAEVGLCMFRRVRYVLAFLVLEQRRFKHPTGVV